MLCNFWTLSGVQAVVGQRLSSATARSSPSRRDSTARITFGMRTEFHACVALQPAFQDFGAQLSGCRAVARNVRQPRANILRSQAAAWDKVLAEPLVKMMHVMDIGQPWGVSYIAGASLAYMSALTRSRHWILNLSTGIASMIRRAVSVSDCSSWLTATRHGLVDRCGGAAEMTIGVGGCGVGSTYKGQYIAEGAA